MIGRRKFITLLGSGAAWPVAARTQQPALPVIGFLSGRSPGESASVEAAFRKGLSEAGYVGGPQSAHRVPLGRWAICFSGFNPVELGLVTSLNRPGGNLTGFAFLTEEVLRKQLGLIHELLPRSRRFAILWPSTSPVIPDLRTAAESIGVEIEVLEVGTNAEIDAAFGALVQRRIEALLVENNFLFRDRRTQILTLAARHAIPVIYGGRADAEAGGLMSYGPNINDGNRQFGIYTGRVLKGEKPADLPVMRSTRFEFLINLQTAKTLGAEVPPTLLALADEVIE